MEGFLQRRKERRLKDRSSERKVKEGGAANQITSTFANSLAATLSPFSSFVSLHSPRGSRRTSASPQRLSPNFAAISQPSSPSSVDRTSSCASQFERRRDTPVRHRSPNASLRVRHSWGAPGSSSSPSGPSSPSPTPSPAASSPSLSPATSQSSSSSVSEDEGGFHHGRGGTRPKIRVSNADDDDDGRPSMVTPPHPHPPPQPHPPRIFPYRIEVGWELYHSNDMVAKHR